MIFNNEQKKKKKNVKGKAEEKLLHFSCCSLCFWLSSQMEMNT